MKLYVSVLGMLILSNNSIAADCVDSLGPKTKGAEFVACLKAVQSDIASVKSSLKEERNRILDLENKLANSHEPIPSGAVIAFKSSETEPCPGTDWIIYNDAKGRFIIGAGQTAYDSDLTSRIIGETGGLEAVPLTEEQMPPHDHFVGVADVQGITLGSPGGKDDNVLMPYFEDGSSNIVETKSRAVVMHAGGKGGVDGKTGEVTDHPNIPPFLALRYCIKE